MYALPMHPKLNTVTREAANTACKEFLSMGLKKSLRAHFDSLPDTVFKC